MSETTEMVPVAMAAHPEMLGRLLLNMALAKAMRALQDVQTYEAGWCCAYLLGGKATKAERKQLGDVVTDGLSDANALYAGACALLQREFVSLSVDYDQRLLAGIEAMVKRLRKEMDEIGPPPDQANDGLPLPGVGQ